MVIGDILIAALFFAAFIIPLVVIHEIGHFVAAKAFGVKVLEFGIGMPPRIKGIGWKRGETEYTFNWLPIGGFVRLLGEEDPTDPRSLAAQAPWKRLVILSAGVVMNIVLAVLLLSFGFMIPRERSLTQAQIVEVADGSPAAEARVEGEMQDGSEPLQGIQPGDIVIEAEGRSVENTDELIFVNRLNLGETQHWVINRGGSTLDAFVHARWDPPPGEGPTGVRVGAPVTCSDVDANGDPINCQLLYPFTESVWDWPWIAIPKGASSLVDALVLTRNEIQVRLSGRGGEGNPTNDQPIVSGPVGIAATTSDIVQQAGWRAGIQIAALLSLSLGVMNTLPIPALDGGRMLFVVIEILRGGKRVSPEREGFVHLVGFALLLSMFVVVTFADIRHLLN